MKVRRTYLQRWLPQLRIYAVLGAMALLLVSAPLLQRLPLPQARPALAPALTAALVIVDPGHGGYDPGMVGDNSVEKDVNLQIALKLAQLLQSSGADVMLTRSDDSALGQTKHADLVQRAALCQDSAADVFISLHCNSFVSSRSQHGAQVFFRKDNASGQALAETLQAELSQHLGNTDRSALPHGGSYLLDNIDCAAVICEMGFLTNIEEEALLQDEQYQWELAWALLDGLNKHLSADAAPLD